MAKFKPLPTVKVKADTELGYQIINESDYDESEHSLFEGTPSKPLADPNLAKATNATRRLGVKSDKSEDKEEDQK